MPEAKQSTVSQQSTAEDSVRSPLITDMGDTTIAENVVAKLSGIAAREVPGVYSMGTAARRAFDTLTDRIPGSQTNVSGGVSVEKGEKQTAIDLTIVVEYGTSIVEVAEAIRRNVIRAVEQGTGLQVVEVNIEVTDVHLPGDDDDQQSSGDTVELN
ncbi:Uncharacterized conserved protein YloU, alkaline shock protein (Asp23) family [Brevibacterium sp. 239c]|uniref:Asp23/Gls24 family envelope stress response protein n=1 Tax=Brevibacterium sp. 239c TaxID=1965356 RepID=UPI000C3E5F31|nr:Asp23/Gls24 family envelope stress response protein [Brevibacterium sp. 239c]SMX82457.1 Uncharacterized conserved protein YloU, alkaline shock protein (Asp23) family [Brevibacterium sp. 239c]